MPIKQICSLDPDLHPTEYPLYWMEYLARKNNDGLDGMACSASEILLDGSNLSDIMKVTFRPLGKPYRSGPRKGKHRWLEEGSRAVYLDRRIFRQEHLAYEKATGRCYNCTDGTVRNQTCPNCKGTAKAPQ